MTGAGEQAQAPSGSLEISALEVPRAGMLGLTHCPGRNHRAADGRHWQRDLAADLAAVEAWGATALLTLLELPEFARLGIADLPAAVGRTRLSWLHLPIPDMQPPGAAFAAAWEPVRSDVLGRLRRGERLVIHCAAGLGRSGTVAAKLLVTFDVPAAAAVALVRRVRPGAVETPAQEAYVRSGPPL
ncbi:MAG: dual specificity protein phosphatase family protein [Alphaproteobacteria bacterium]|nr:dual specificity protein phosphatase family protein [Alphaproteobacteria bacterium]